jgi:multicomponent Na+:H+ antiporter subunit F
MNVWHVGATILLVAVFPCAWVVARATIVQALVALELVATVVTLVLLLVAEGYHRNSYFTLPLVLAFMNLAGALIFARFLGDRDG